MTTFSSLDPATGAAVWTGPAADAAAVDAAVARARAAFPAWARRPLAERQEIARALARAFEARAGELAEAISREVGKPRWEAATEVKTMVGKVALSIEAQQRRCAEFAGGPAVTRFRPHGVVAVLGPFNFPGHLPNGHLVPALLAGNTAVFKPSECAPWVAELTAECWRAAGLPEGVLNVVQGGRETGAALAGHPGLDGLYFTGSARAGLELSAQFARTPGKILALELGGNNPLVVWEPADVAVAARVVAASAYLSAGQRCTCARRLIVPDNAAGRAVLDAVTELAARLRFGPFTDAPEPFAGPVIREAAALRVLAEQERAEAAGARALVRARHLRPGTGLISAGLLDVTEQRGRRDEEVFGPLLQAIRVPDFAAALAEANATAYGLSAGLLSARADLWEEFQLGARAGIVNWNHQLTGASGAAPFGGLGLSGNHRPSGFFAADYCAYPVASIAAPELAPPALPVTWP